MRRDCNVYRRPTMILANSCAALPFGQQSSRRRCRFRLDVVALVARLESPYPSRASQPTGPAGSFGSLIVATIRTANCICRASKSRRPPRRRSANTILLKQTDSWFNLIYKLDLRQSLVTDSSSPRRQLCSKRESPATPHSLASWSPSWPATSRHRRSRHCKPSS